MPGNSLRVRVGSIELRHPIMNASGILGSEPEHIEILASWGLAAVVTKTITSKPREGNPPPIIMPLRNGGFINAVGLANKGKESIEALCAKAKNVGIPIIVSVGGSSTSEFVEVAGFAERCGANAIELNLSCPHTPGYGIEIGSDPLRVFEIVKNVVCTVSIPVIAKLGLSDRIVASAGKALEAGAKALTLINTIRAMAIDVYSAKPLLSNIFGGLSGPPIHPIAVRVVYEVYREYQCDIIGCGGVSTWEDAAELILAGAKGIQIGSSLSLGRGPEVVKGVLRGLVRWLKSLGLKSIEEAVGLAHRV